MNISTAVLLHNGMQARSDFDESDYAGTLPRPDLYELDYNIVINMIWWNIYNVLGDINFAISIKTSNTIKIS